MAYLTIENATVTGSQAIFNLKELMKSAAYTVLSSSTGLAGGYNASGDNIVTGSSGAGGMANNNAWFRIRSPDGINEWVFQRGTNNTSWRIVCNFGGAPFDGGSPGDTVTPDSANGFAAVGGGTSASPTFGSAVFSGDGTYRWKALVDNAAPYGWWAGGVLTAGSNPATCFVWDPLEATHPSDNLKYVFYGSGMAAAPVGTLNFAYGLENGGVLGGREFVLTRIPNAGIGSMIHEGLFKLIGVVNSTQIVNYEGNLAAGIGSHPISGADTALPVFYGRSVSTSNSHFKGASSFLRTKTVSRGTGSVLEFNSGQYWVVMRDFILPWNKSTFDL